MEHRHTTFSQGIGSPLRPSQHFWGENLEGVQHRPLHVALPNKIVYSPHTYGPSLRTSSAKKAGELSFFDSPDFPNNMVDAWSSRWGYVMQRMSLCVCVGEWGGTAVGADLAWQSKLVQFLLDGQVRVSFSSRAHALFSDTRGTHCDTWHTSTQHTTVTHLRRSVCIPRNLVQMSSFMWSLNSNDGHTQGFLDGWGKPKPAKLALLQRLPATPIIDTLRSYVSRVGTALAVGSPTTLAVHPKTEAPAAIEAVSLLTGACAKPYGECTSSHCCEQAYPGKSIVCFQRDEGYAGCLDWCKPPWTCARLGEATAFSSPPGMPPPPSPPPPPPSPPWFALKGLPWPPVAPRPPPDPPRPPRPPETPPPPAPPPPPPSPVAPMSSRKAAHKRGSSDDDEHRSVVESPHHEGLSPPRCATLTNLRTRRPPASCPLFSDRTEAECVLHRVNHIACIWVEGSDPIKGVQSGSCMGALMLDDCAAAEPPPPPPPRQTRSRTTDMHVRGSNHSLTANGAVTPSTSTEGHGMGARTAVASINGERRAGGTMPSALSQQLHDAHAHMSTHVSSAKRHVGAAAAIVTTMMPENATAAQLVPSLVFMCALPFVAVTCYHLFASPLIKRRRARRDGATQSRGVRADRASYSRVEVVHY